MTPPKLSIVIVSFNTRPDLERCLESLTGSPPAIPHEIVVVDNASTDGSVDAVRRRWPAVRVVAQRRNAGFAAANNTGIRASSGTLLLLLNSDCVVPGGAIDRLVERLRAHPDAAVAGPRLVDATGRTELSFGRMISPWAELRQKALGIACNRGLGPAVRWVDRAVSSERYVDWVSGACSSTRRCRGGRPALLVYRADAEAPACSTNATSSTRRTWTSAPPSVPAGGGCCSRRRQPSPTCAAAPARRFRGG